MNPVFEIQDLTDTYIKFRLSKVPLSYANALRRVMISEVPTMAIEFVTIKENTTPLHDEYIAHRMGLLPLASSAVEHFNYRIDCSCSDNTNCPLCSVKFRLSIKNLGDDIRNVTTDDLKPEYRPEGHVQGKVDHQMSVKPVTYPVTINGETNIRSPLIMKLGKNQQLDMECVATKGIGREHGKWSPVCVAAMKMEPKVTVNEVRGMQLSIDNRKAFVDCCPTKVFGLHPNKQSIEVKNEKACMFCYECLKIQKELNIEDLVRVEDGDYLFEVESTGALRPDEIVSFAFDILHKKIETLKSELNTVGMVIN